MIQNLIGKTFNNLTVIEGPIRRMCGQKNRIYWVCKCKCGNEIEVRGDQLKAGVTKSCGCLKVQRLIENNKKRQTLDLTNKRYGKLIAIKPTEKRSSDGRVIWECKCDCGNIYYTDTHSLQLGRVQSCGCLKSKGEFLISNILKENNIAFEQEKVFNTCKFENGYYAKFDFWINNSYLIEYDGQQHFYSQSGKNTWNTEENLKYVQLHDQYKNQWCKENNIPLIRIPYTHYNDLCLDDLLLETSKFII